MPFIPHTPESLIPRSDSKNAATTCKGITLSGRPCRRDLKTQESDVGVLAVVSNDDDATQGAAAYFCYRHKDQAEKLTQSNPTSGAAALYPLNKRSSTDTLMDRLGVVDLNHERPGHKKKRASANKEGLPQKWQDVPGPLLAVSASEKPGARPKPKRRRPHPLLALLCCGSYDDYDDARPLAAPMPQKQETSSLPETRRPAAPQRTQQTMHSSRKADDRRRSSSARPALADKSTNPQNRPQMPRDPSSQTENLLPKTLSPQTTSLLLSELAKPVSKHDEEGYIYIFMLTPTSTGTGTPQPKDASALLSTTPLPSPRQRRPSSNAQAQDEKAAYKRKSDGTILLKIGRASNIQRRMNEWTRQCNHDLSLVRYYPYIPSSSSPSSLPPSNKTLSLPFIASGVPRKVPHAHKVERLIHIELADKRVKRRCETCGKEHREWFEVRGDREGVKAVDEVVRRWVGWGEGR